jgi:hypothetical protein
VASGVPRIQTQSLPIASFSAQYSADIQAVSDLPLTWAVDTGSLPPGLDIDADTGKISGTPTADGTFDFAIRAVNSVGIAVQMLSIRVDSINTSTHNVSFDGTTFTLGDVNLTGTGVMQGRDVYVVVNRYDASNTKTALDARYLSISADGSGMYSAVHTFALNERIEILVYEDNASQWNVGSSGLITRQIVKPALFSFSEVGQ